LGLRIEDLVNRYALCVVNFCYYFERELFTSRIYIHEAILLQQLMPLLWLKKYCTVNPKKNCGRHANISEFWTSMSNFSSVISGLGSICLWRFSSGERYNLRHFSDDIITTSKLSLDCREDSTGGTSRNGAPDVRKHATIRRLLFQ
jgi:hypothetical protein